MSDGREFDTDDEVIFTDKDGKERAGIVHGVSYQQGRSGLVGEHHEIPDDKNSPVVPGTGRMEIIPGTENERHSFSYIVVPKEPHAKWWEINRAHQVHQQHKLDALEKHPKLLHPEAFDKHFKDIGYTPPALLNEQPPELKQFRREASQLKKVA